MNKTCYKNDGMTYIRDHEMMNMIFLSLLYFTKTENIYSSPVKISLAYDPACYIYDTNNGGVRVSNGDIGNNVANIKVVNGQNQLWYGNNQVCNIADQNICEPNANSLKIVPADSGLYNIKNNNRCLVVKNAPSNGNAPYKIDFENCVNTCEQKFRINTLNQENFNKQNNRAPSICEINSFPNAIPQQAPAYPQNQTQQPAYYAPSQPQQIVMPPPLPPQQNVVYVQAPPTSQPQQFAQPPPQQRYVPQQNAPTPVKYTTPTNQCDQPESGNKQNSELPFESEIIPTQQEYNQAPPQNEDVKTVQYTPPAPEKDVTVVTVETPFNQQPQSERNICEESAPQVYNNNSLSSSPTYPQNPPPGYQSVAVLYQPIQTITQSILTQKPQNPPPTKIVVQPSQTPNNVPSYVPRNTIQNPQQNDCVVYQPTNNTQPRQTIVEVQQPVYQPQYTPINYSNNNSQPSIIVQSPGPQQIDYSPVQSSYSTPQQTFIEVQQPNYNGLELQEPVPIQQNQYQAMNSKFNSSCELVPKTEMEPTELQSNLNQITKTMLLQNTPTTSPRNPPKNCEYVIQSSPMQSPKNEVEYITTYEPSYQPRNENPSIGQLYDTCEDTSPQDKKKNYNNENIPKVIKYQDSNPNSPIRIGKRQFDVEYVNGTCK